MVAFGGGFSKPGEAEAQAPLSQSSPRFPSAAGSSVRWLFRASVRVFLIDVVTLRSPGPGLSRAGRGTDIPGEWGRSSRSARGPLSSPSPPGWRCVGRKKGCGTRPDLALPPPCPSGRRVGRVVSMTQRTLSARLSWLCPAGGPSPRRGGASRRRAARFRLGARVRFALVLWLLLERSGSSLRCPRPSRCCRPPSPVSFPSGSPAVAVLRGGGPRLGVSPAGQGRHARVPRPRVRGGPDLRRCPGGVGARERGRAGDAGRWLNREVSVAAVLLSWAG